MEKIVILALLLGHLLYAEGPGALLDPPETLQPNLCHREFLALGIGPVDPPLHSLPATTTKRIALVQEMLDQWLVKGLIDELALGFHGGLCADCSARLQQALRGRGLGTTRIRVKNALPIKFLGGKALPADNFHSFLILAGGPGSEEVIIDSTYRQYFHPSIRSRLPKVFVGTRNQLQTLFQDHRDDIIGEEGQRLPGVDAKAYVDVTFGFGPAAATRQEQ